MVDCQLDSELFSVPFCDQFADCIHMLRKSLIDFCKLLIAVL